MRANVWHGWNAEARPTFPPSTTGVPLDDQATWLEFAGGVTLTYSAKMSFYAQAGYQFAVAPSNVSRDGFTGDVGLRYSW